ncbi:cytochrome ubiquinol oxidase subunit I [Candidatus Sulfidibacterium hydrothermale]|uniref:cytochrome ubiquinol oxidase subunit I n=1 Tax=Candidatus Sulfidibacterium hydrothermale TaxID=2875962 RepID=UPI001F0ABEC8|nr:cytochrome ubiquinol oxidase subunit I [Candidatus Sulfidibacterium hydrothermale]UBM61735.1 cytochrome ubiquinol oxidase subunit I [Candidatus Sulfidibacterium hydrothermale]
MEHFNMALVDWSRAQFALTALYHWLFVPLTLGTSFILAIMETIYVKTGKEIWKRITKFWMTLFAINFAIGVATGIILEFEFGTNWSNYSWFVGDIFGAPLAIEGIMAFFMESTFFAVMFFGWNKVSKGFHLTSTWLVAIGSNLSALWILVANAWMQNPVGMHFNPETARNEMVDFWAILFSPTAVNKFLHTISSAYVLSAIFVLGVSAWFLLKKRNEALAKRSMIVAGTFGLIMSIFMVTTGDESARQIFNVQPMKFASMEGLYHGESNAALTAVGFFTKVPKPEDPDANDWGPKIKIPGMLSYLATLDPKAYVPGINDMINGNKAHNIISYYDRIKMGKLAIAALKEFQLAKKAKNDSKAAAALKTFEANYKYFGYGYYDDPHKLIPDVPLTFYSFHIMVGLGTLFIFIFLFAVIYGVKGKLTQKRWLLYVALWAIPFAYLAQEAGWMVAEFGRQPWVVQDYMPTLSAVSNIDQTSVIITFFLFAVVFTVLLIAEVKIMLNQIKQLKDGGQQ